ncbi:putative toxin-antitoxin system toxin component, PIN family [Hippea alviniae]|uniref:putative toxin-antitoxin system toxin component, PIN family n=1 Tax=Hippea alviniae TaxID=1279027 RepID=UPI0003B4772B|nr:putative toxin-antitoxin system toxin component, PIN family [Hippea alviniae]
MKKVVVDTNIIFSILLKDKNKERDFLFLSSGIKFFTCRFMFVELFKYKEKIVKYSHLKENEVLSVLYDVSKIIEFYNEDLISYSSKVKAFDLCKDIDEKDTPFVALSLELNAYLWTGDKKLINGLKNKGFNRFILI